MNEKRRTQSQMRKLWPGPGYYDAAENSSSKCITIIRDGENASIEQNEENEENPKINNRNLITPGPGDYLAEQSSVYLGSQKGGTGTHNGFAISFAKDTRKIN
mmetsp:Transcript_24582/g.24180  ORF Transcript_24582/g.24180 Transcript_24582/m.24180 type:complete len:103 (-) Transcript_24582:1075-1383(-)|eukprot:CAMPEP_0170562174 /NCGR_PEP_ID=MMETSP0211-20121228/59148_1 /TAXON_ID=311385 /ORGANISM="Pseudokeronopsis sp., Strain OXSARD2" /LENGTH=102 /DNA_ID=CAMNT_0010878711 /DNA_START=258 /DNA_END=566 /DNA_ORIENTATION=-